MDNSGQAYRVYSGSKIYLSPTARAWAREWGMSDAEMAQYLIQRHQESGDPFVNDVGSAAYTGDVGEAAAAQRLLETEYPFE